MFWAISNIEFPIPSPIPNQPPAFIGLPSSIFQFPDVYNYVAYIASFFNLMVGVIIIVFTTNELKYKTQRQNVIDGLSKVDVIMAKFIVVVLLAAVISLYTFLVSFIFGALNGSISDMFNGIELIGVYFVSTVGYFIFAFFFANLVRLPALAIVLYLVSTTVEGIVGLIATSTYVEFFPLTMFSALVPFPMDIFEVPDFMWGQGGRVALSLGYIAIFTIISYMVIRKRDV
jgi:ABC-2 type transport system permease protein